MPVAAAERRDPTTAAVLSAFVPGAGLLYVGRPRAAAWVFIVECVAWALGWWLLLIVVHAWQVVVAGGEAAVAGARHEDVFRTARVLAAEQAAADQADA